MSVNKAKVPGGARRGGNLEESLPLLATLEGDIGFDSNKRNWGKDLLLSIPDILRHPFALLLMSSALIPLLIFVFNTYKTRVDARQKKALEIVEKNANFDSQLNLLSVDFAFFYKNNVRLFAEIDSLRTSDPGDKAANLQLENKKKELRNKAKDFRSQVFDHYSQLVKSFPDSEKNIWVDGLFVQGMILNLFSADDLKALKLSRNGNQRLAQLQSDIEAYKTNYISSLALINGYQDKFFEDMPDTKRFDLVNKELNQRYNDLNNARQEVVSNLVEDFTPGFSLRFWE